MIGIGRARLVTALRYSLLLAAVTGAAAQAAFESPGLGFRFARLNPR